MAKKKKKRCVLFLCNGNACRSPMAEGFLRALAPHRYEILSAGLKPGSSVHPLAVDVMSEVGVDISSHQPRSVKEFLPPRGNPPDVVVSLCGSGGFRKLHFPEGVGKIQWEVVDPFISQGNEEIQLSLFRGSRNEIQALIKGALKNREFDRPREKFTAPLKSNSLKRAISGLGEIIRKKLKHD